jgi:crotonobetainyl-CoA:carnitine CoA-transferase CaiB-like acyl-CoA transferase
VTVRDVDGRPVNLVGSPFHIAGTTLAEAKIPPRLGQDTDEVLGELLGIDTERLSQLRRQGVI